MFSHPFKIYIFLLSSFIGFAVPLNVSHSNSTHNNCIKKSIDSLQTCIDNLKQQYLSPYTEEEGDSNQQKSKLTLKSDCETHKADAEECCSNPNKCSGLMKDLTTSLLPLAPVLYQTVNSYKTSKDIISAKITPQEASKKMCDVKNKTSLSMFGGQLSSQMMDKFQTTCRDRITECQEKCNQDIDKFKKAFFECFKDYVNKQTLTNIVGFAKKCAGDIDLNSETELQISNIQEEINNLQNTCKIEKNTGETNNCKKPAATAIVDILLFAKAYRQTSIGQKYSLTDNSNEEEIINCSKQPKRVVTERPGAGGSKPPIPPPVIDLCERYVQDTLNSPPPNLPPVTPDNYNPPRQGSLDNTSSFGGNTRLVPPEGEGITNANLGIVSDLPDPFNKPSLRKNVPGWSNTNGGGPGGSSPGGGGPGGSASAPDISSGYGGSPSSPYYPGSGLGTGMFSGGDFMPSSGGGWNDRSLSGAPVASKGDAPAGFGDPYEFPEDDKDENTNKDNIFGSASQRIQLFCSDYDCS